MAQVAGFSARNGDNYIQVDQDYQNLVLVFKGQTTSAARPRPYYTAFAQTWIPNTVQALAFRSPNNVTIWGFQASGAGWLVEFLVMGAGATIDVYGFGQPPPPSAKFGLQVFRGDGSLAFSSEFNYMRVERIIIRPRFNTYSEALPSGKTYAICQGQPSSNFRIMSVPAHNADLFEVTRDAESAFLNCWGSTFSVTSDLYYSTSSRNPNPIEGYQENPQVYAMILDVTNF